MYTLNISRAIKKMSVNEIRYFIFENYYKHFGSFLRKKIRKSLKQSEIITYQPKNFDTVDIKSVTAEHPKYSLKLSRL